MHIDVWQKWSFLQNVCNNGLNFQEDMLFMLHTMTFDHFLSKITILKGACKEVLDIWYMQFTAKYVKIKELLYRRIIPPKNMENIVDTLGKIAYRIF